MVCRDGLNSEVDRDMFLWENRRESHVIKELCTKTRAMCGSAALPERTEHSHSVPRLMSLSVSLMLL